MIINEIRRSIKLIKKKSLIKKFKRKKWEWIIKNRLSKIKVIIIITNKARLINI